MQFNPFNKAVSKLRATDLKVLGSINEGWYIEYKRELPKNGSKINISKIAKSITSFANTFGGWLFYGVDEGTDSKELSFCGIDKPIRAERYIKEALVYQSNPEPYFETKIIKGPSKTLGLPKGKSVLVVHIPESNNLPHIHGSGMIYRRVGESSEPIVEKDRARLDVMWEKKKDTHSKLKSFLEESPPENTFNVPMLHIYLMTDPMGVKGHRSSMNFNTFSSIMREGELSFDNVYTASNHYVARYIQNNDINGNLLTLQYYDNGACVISLPFSAINLNGEKPSCDSDIFTKYKFGESFLQQVIKQGKNKGWMIDLNLLYLSLSATLSKYKSLLAKDCIQQSIGIKFRLDNIAGTLPFIDSEPYMLFLKEFGLPSPIQNKCYFPENETFLNLKEFYESCLSEKETTMHDAMVLFIKLVVCFGVPVQALLYKDEGIKEGTSRIIKELFNLKEKESMGSD